MGTVGMKLITALMFNVFGVLFNFFYKTEISQEFILYYYIIYFKFKLNFILLCKI